MNTKEAKAELEKIMSQKTVSISRLKKILCVLDYEHLEKQYINAGRKIKRQQERLRHLETRGRNSNE